MREARWKRGLAMLGLGLAVLGGGTVAFTGSDGAPTAQSSRLRAVGPEVLIQVPWGVGRSDLGRFEGDEAASEGPMSFAVGGDGTFWFLDQTRMRLVQFDDQAGMLRDVPLGSDTFQDFELMQDGSFVLLDRLARRILVVLDAAGNHVRDVSVEGPGIPEGGGVTGMLADADGIWLEFNHTERVRVLDGQLLPCKREVVRGRAFRPGVELLGALDGRGGALVWTEDRNRGNASQSRSISAKYDIARIVWLETDSTGDVHAVFHLMQFDDQDPTRLIHEEVWGARYDETLRPRDSWTSPFVIQDVEQFREVRLGPDGTVYQMGFDNRGVSVVRWRWVK